VSQAPARQRILVITRNLPPLRGGMERLNLHMIAELAKEFSVSVVGISGCRGVLPEEVATHEISAKPLWRFFLGALFCGIFVARRFRPAVVLAGSGLTAPFAWFAARSSGARLAIYVHGLDLVAGHPIYRHGWLPFIRRANLCIANSSNTARLATEMGVPGERIVIVHPGVELPPAPSGPNPFRHRFDLGDRPLMLSVGRLVARKGLLEFVENALARIIAACPEACLVIIGEENPELLNGSSAGLAERIRRSAEARGLGSNVRFLGTQDDAVLGDAFRAADVHVFPGREVADDVEGFGMVAVEAAAHGLPTVAFAVGGIPDAVENGISGTLVPAGDHAGFVDAVVAALEHRAGDDMRSTAVQFAGRFRWELFGEKVRRALGALTTGPNQVP